jgi:putative hydrolase of the HAD superfamily
VRSKLPASVHIQRRGGARPITGAAPAKGDLRARRLCYNAAMTHDEKRRQPDEAFELRPSMEPLTAEEKERFLARVRAQGRALTSEEQYALFGPPPEPVEQSPAYLDVTPMDAPDLDGEQMQRLQQDFFPELPNPGASLPLRLVQGVIFDFDETLAYLAQPLEELMTAGAQAAEAYMRSTGMTLPPDFAPNIVEARRFAEEKSLEEKEEHLADDALSFLLQFYGYPTSRMDPQVLKQAVDIFYAPEMTAWRLRPGVKQMLQALIDDGCKLALLANYNCDRVFQRTIDYLGLRPYFDVCICSAAVEYRKPDPNFFNVVLERWEALPYEAVVVGDSLVDDVQGGLETGTLTIWLNAETTPQVQHHNEMVREAVKPDHIVTSLDEVPALVRAWS